MAFIANKFSQQGIVAIICAINPYDEIRKELIANYKNVKTVYVQCSLDKLVDRDTKGLYKKALLPDGHIDKIYNLTGVNDTFELPQKADLIIQTDSETLIESTKRLVDLIHLNT